MLDNIEQIWISLGVLAGIIGTASGWIASHHKQIKLLAEKVKNKDLEGTIAGIIALMSSDVPQTEEQTALITSRVVPDKTWKMTEDRKEALFQTLRDSGDEIRRADLFAVIEKAEAANQVQYGIILYDHAGKPDRSIINKGLLIDGKIAPEQEHEVYHAFVNYGSGEVQPYEQTMQKVNDTFSKAYPLEIYWYMTDAEKEKLMSNIGYNNPKCINEAQAIIDEAEAKQKESYYVGCGIHTFKVVKGNVTEISANPKFDNPATATVTSETIDAKVSTTT